MREIWELVIRKVNLLSDGHNKQVSRRPADAEQTTEGKNNNKKT